MATRRTIFGLLLSIVLIGMLVSGCVIHAQGSVSSGAKAEDVAAEEGEAAEPGEADAVVRRAAPPDSSDDEAVNDPPPPPPPAQ